MTARLALATAAVFAGLLSLAATRTAPLRIMPVGDSITEGDLWSGSYRVALGEALRDAGISFDFVGTQNAGPNGYDNDHEGFPGWTIGDMRGYIGPVVDSIRPDAILLMIGTNDMWPELAVDELVSSLDSLITLIRTRSPVTRVVVGSIPPIDYEGASDVIGRYTAASRASIESKGDPMVTFADVCSQLTLEDLFDGVHPDSSGHAKIAQGWFSALSKVYGWSTHAIHRRRAISRPSVRTRSPVDLTGRTQSAAASRSRRHFRYSGGSLR